MCVVRRPHLLSAIILPSAEKKPQHSALPVLLFLNVFMRLWNCALLYGFSPYFPPAFVCEFSCSVDFFWICVRKTEYSSNCDGWHSPQCPLQKTLRSLPCPYCKVGAMLTWRMLFVETFILFFLEPEVSIFSSEKKYGASSMKIGRENIVYRFRKKGKLRAFSKAYQSNT